MRLTVRVQVWRFGILLGLTSLTGCAGRSEAICVNGLFPGRVRPIERIQDCSGTDYIVRLRGTVGDRAPLLNGQVYQLQDSTGEVWVLTSDTTLKTGEQIVIRGRVRYQSIPLAGREQGEFYVEELSQLE
ncbi:MAG: hypothetical protein HC840_01790 [Leptolyngbyaceae cyanobacterium RM2_2_4]|nr:hypothetical protein [Leptolyngbyaceae cyanobacterium SM1_4_3]NJO48410.1 hypothetical protein [Leptolyngbyaceae cyanobacterium RM2_2_4]NJO66976.1 hypothetical protein [Leptolyngbyaceae cyanobacterium RM1_405_57]